MGEQITVRNTGRKISVFSAMPWSMLLIAYMLVVQLLKANLNGVAGYVFAALCLLVLFAEFFKSGDIGTWTFLVDLLGALFTLILATVLLCYLMIKLGQTPTFFHWLGYAVILGDAILSPFNGFRTALRNIGLGSAG
jgi:hypothetical protein